ncbi:MAG: kduD [Acidobacteria bacterium]|jgi:NAD(P)-dependent dehydrogenase (short-subunit alcohol dehydrogenase family)|nr:kduD [Acidobacteriota bacterium]
MIQAENITDLTGRTAVVIGGTSGLGRAIATGLARSGANVVAAGRRLELIEEVCAEIESLGRETLRHTVDVSKRESIDLLRDAVIDRFKGVDILVNAAGRTARTASANVEEAEWTAIIDTNLNGMLRACQSFYEPLKKSGSGRIVNIASLASFVAFHEVAAYGASKAGALALTRSLGCEWARDGINVNAIVPGVFPTELNEKLLNGTERGREILMRTPMKRFGRTEEITGAAVFLSSAAASFITGQSIAVDGGFLASGVNS